jgi:uncharacterized protein (DUF1499 family)
MKFKFVLLTVVLIPHVANANFQRLPHCLNSPNCVSSQASQLDRRHYIAPFKIKGTPETAWLTLKQILKQQDRTVITHETDSTLNAEAISLIFSFVDDMELVLDSDAGMIHIRSASRMVHSDFGINRRRIEDLRELMQQANVVE